MWAVFRIKLLDYRNSMPLLIGFVGMMLVFTFIFGLAFSSGEYMPTSYIVNRGETQEAQLLVKRLQESDDMAFEVVDYEMSVSRLERSKGVGAIVIDEEEGQIVTSIMTTQPTNETLMLHTILRGVLARLVNDVALSEHIYGYMIAQGEKPEVQKEAFLESIQQRVSDLREDKVYFTTKVDYVDTSANGYDNLKHALTGFTVFFSMFLGFFGIGSIVEEKVNHVWQRQLVSPISNLSILGGNLGAALIVGIMNVLVMIYGGKYLFKVDWGNSDLGVMLLLSAFVFASTCLGLLVSSLVKNMQQLSAITPVIVVSTSMLGGCMWPLEMIQSKVLLNIAKLTPQRWAIHGVEEMIMYGKGIEVIVLPICVLLGMGVVFLGVGSYLVRIERH